MTVHQNVMETMVMVAVCGSDNKVYYNDCFMKKAICEDKTETLRKVNSDVCPGKHYSICIVAIKLFFLCSFGFRTLP